MSLIEGYGTPAQRTTTTYAYTHDNKVLTVADAKNNRTTYIYDGFDRLYQTQYPSPTTAGSSNAADYEQLTYDAAANVTGRRLRDGTSVAYAYDALNRLSGKTLPNGEHAVSYAYDNLGHPTTITGASALSYGWDALGRMTRETQPFGSVAYQYDAAGRRTRLTWQDGIYLTYGYDNANEMTSISENGGTTLASFAYDDLAERKTRTLANGTSTTYGYDAISRLTSLALAGGTNVNTVTLSNYSPASEIGGRANSNDAYAWAQAYNLSRAYTANGLNQFATVAGAAQGYDGRGNLASSGGTAYAFTSENLLKAASGGYAFAYDPIGRLDEYDAPTTTRFVYDGAAISEELNSTGSVLRRYAFGPAGDEPIVWYEGSGTATKRYIDQDERGSVTRITDGTGATIAVNSYDEFGIPGAANQGRFNYTGQAWLSEVGLAYYKARVYSPTLGRFLQTDPIGYGDGPNRYNYAGSDPVNRIDPSGFQSYELTGSSSTSGSSGSEASGGGFSIGSSSPYPGAGSLIGPPPRVNMTYGIGTVGAVSASSTSSQDPFATDNLFASIALPQRPNLDPGKVESDPVMDIVVTAGIGGTMSAAEGLFEAGYDALSNLIASSARGVVSREIIFGTEHALPHFVGTGLSQPDIEAQIGAELDAQFGGISRTTVEGPFRGQTDFGGTTIQYHGFGLPNGNVNIGTYYPIGR